MARRRKSYGALSPYTAKHRKLNIVVDIARGLPVHGGRGYYYTAHACIGKAGGYSIKATRCSRLVGGKDRRKVIAEAVRDAVRHLG